MTELIKITETETGNQVVSARELHYFLEVKTQFTKWCQRMFEYGFSSEKDYTEVLVKNDYNPTGGRPETDYALTLETAKEISMIQRNAKGKEARQYFIDCERIAKQNAKPAILDPLEFLQMSLNQMKAQSIEIDLVKKQVAELEVRTHTRPEYYTVMAFGIINNYTIGLEEAKKLGQAASKICKDNEWTVEKTRDYRFGFVGVYPQKALEKAWIKINQ